MDDIDVMSSYVPAFPPGEQAVRWHWRCTACPLDRRGSVGSAPTEDEARTAAAAHIAAFHPAAA